MCESILSQYLKGTIIFNVAIDFTVHVLSPWLQSMLFLAVVLPGMPDSSIKMTELGCLVTPDLDQDVEVRYNGDYAQPGSWSCSASVC